MYTFYFLDHLAYERMNERQQLADEIRRAALAEPAERKGQQATLSWLSFLLRPFTRRLVPEQDTK